MKAASMLAEMIQARGWQESMEFKSLGGAPRRRDPDLGSWDASLLRRRGSLELRIRNHRRVPPVANHAA